MLERCFCRCLSGCTLYKVHVTLRGICTVYVQYMQYRIWAYVYIYHNNNNNNIYTHTGCHTVVYDVTYKVFSGGEKRLDVADRSESGLASRFCRIDVSIHLPRCPKRPRAKYLPIDTTYSFPGRMLPQQVKCLLFVLRPTVVFCDD
jgi:hypothetical protein